MPSFLSPTGHSAHSCGYCHSQTESSKSTGAWAHFLSPLHYQLLIDSGWRRSGQYLYKPTQDTCCFTYTIRLNTSLFQLSKGQKKTIRKIRKYIHDDVGQSVLSESSQGQAVLQDYVTDKPMPDSFHAQNQVSDSISMDLSTHSVMNSLIVDSEGSTKTDKKHDFKVVLVPSQFEQETFDLYCKYQVAVHRDKPDKLSQKSFTSFLVNSPIQVPFYTLKVAST
jgi:arginine-tRNA-protein transferase